jgi:hypothetical protein
MNISPSTRFALELLEQLASGSKSVPAADVWQRVEQAQEPMVALYLMSYLVEPKSLTYQQIVSLLRRKMENYSTAERVWLERASRHSEYRSVWSRNSVAVIRQHWQKWQAIPDMWPHVWGIVSFHRDGFIRQAALQEIGKGHQGQGLAYLLLRLTDYVPLVADEAASLLENGLVQSWLPYWVQCLPLLYQLRSWKRGANSGVFRSALTWFSREKQACKPALWQGIQSDDAPLRSACMKTLLPLIESKENEVRMLLESAYRDPEPGIRMWACSLVAKGVGGRLVQQALVPAMEKSRSKTERWAALKVRSHGPHAHLFLELAVLDRHADIRYWARSKLRHLGSHYNSNLFREQSWQMLMDPGASPDQLCRSLASLSDIGTVADVNKILPWLNHPAIQVQREALRCVRLLDPTSHVNLFVQMLDSKQAFQVQESKRALLHIAQGIDEVALKAMLASTSLPSNLQKQASESLRRIPKRNR